MTRRLLGSLVAAESLIAAAILGVGVGLATDPGIGLATFGGAWWLADLIRGRS